jgi:hypothetical protein
VLSKRQIAWLAALGVVLWIAVAIDIRLRPDVLLDPLLGSIFFLAAPLAGWLSVWLCKVVGRLSPDQLVPGVAVVGAVAMMMDGAALQWFSGIYGFDDKALRLDAAWLLWGYGVAFAVAFLWTAWSRRMASPRPL